MSYQDIKQRIEKDCSEEFTELQREMKEYLSDGFDLAKKRQFLKEHLPKTIKTKSGLLLDTLLNYLMQEATSELQNADVKLQNLFYDQDFRTRIREMTEKAVRDFSRKPEELVFPYEPKWIYDEISKFGKWIVKVAELVVMGLSRIISSLHDFIYSFEKTAPQAIARMEKELNKYIDSEEKQVKEWLKEIVDVFQSEFHEFCRMNGFDYEE